MCFFVFKHRYKILYIIIFCLDFSYQEFVEGKGLTKDHVLSVNDMKDLMDTLGITDFLQKQPCTTSGWTNGKI